MMEESYTPDGVLLTWKGGTQAVQVCREEFIKLLQQWRECQQDADYEIAWAAYKGLESHYSRLSRMLAEGDEREQRETFEMLRKALPHKFPS